MNKHTINIHKNESKNNKPLTYVCGDLNIHGWEVHHGIQYTTNKNDFKFLRMHLELLHRMGGSQWNTIQTSPGREYMILDQLQTNCNNKQVIMSSNYLKDLCYTALQKIVVNIHGFKNHQFQGRNLLANRGKCSAQNLHRDYKPFQHNTTSSTSCSQTMNYSSPRNSRNRCNNSKRKTQHSNHHVGERSSSRKTRAPSRFNYE